ncbi:hypothetical protein [Azospirillum sp.]|uniref:hypothetical protein n=1 Tax=Azospirillum sp. TaxID=34012 RepID=UPI002D3D8C1C|nr:hypothetical protein [Azospirillum sp.]HYD65584.1 hypothetical protein [Azospirillum sp.]
MPPVGADEPDEPDVPAAPGAAFWSPVCGALPPLMVPCRCPASELSGSVPVVELAPGDDVLPDED